MNQLTPAELNTLKKLLDKLWEQRVQKYENGRYPDFRSYTSFEQYEIDDGDNLLEAVDTILYALSYM